MIPDDDAIAPAEYTVRGACPHERPDTGGFVNTVRAGRAVREQGNPAHPHTDGVQ